MLNFLRKVFKRKHKHHDEKVEALEQTTEATLTEKDEKPLANEAIIPKRVTIDLPEAQDSATKALEQEKAPAIYGTRTKASAVKIRKRKQNPQQASADDQSAQGHAVLESNAIHVTQELAKLKPTALTMKEEIELKAKELQFRNKKHNQIYVGEGKDELGLNGRELKSAFVNEKGEKLSADERMQIMKELQTGVRKRAWL